MKAGRPPRDTRGRTLCRYRRRSLRCGTANPPVRRSVRFEARSASRGTGLQRLCFCGPRLRNRTDRLGRARQWTVPIHRAHTVAHGRARTLPAAACGSDERGWFRHLAQVRRTRAGRTRCPRRIVLPPRIRGAEKTPTRLPCSRAGGSRADWPAANEPAARGCAPPGWRAHRPTAAVAAVQPPAVGRKRARTARRQAAQGAEAVRRAGSALRESSPAIREDDRSLHSHRGCSPRRRPRPLERSHPDRRVRAAR